MSDSSLDGASPGRRAISLTFGLQQAEDIMEDLPLGHSVHAATRELFVSLRDWRRSPQQVPQQGVPMPYDHDIEYAPIQPIRPAPTKRPRRGYVVRKVDVTGISGLGVIAEFCQFSDGSVAWRWLGGPPQNQPKWEFYDNPGVNPFVQISGHNGNTEIVWIDEEEPESEEPLVP
jgi:hypothetical protein